MPVSKKKIRKVKPALPRPAGAPELEQKLPPILQIVPRRLNDSVTQIRFSAAQKQRIRAYAVQSGCDMSDVVRRAMDVLITLRDNPKYHSVLFALEENGRQAET